MLTQQKGDEGCVKTAKRTKGQSWLAWLFQCCKEYWAEWLDPLFGQKYLWSGEDQVFSQLHCLEVSPGSVQYPLL
jgi:hypothetical protein